MNQADNIFKKVANIILKNGEKKFDRTGVGTLSIFGTQERFKVTNFFPLLSLRKIHIKSIIHELLWFLGAYDEKYKKFGNTNIKYLKMNGVNFWDEWVYKEYNRLREYRSDLDYLTIEQFGDKIKNNDDFALEFGDLGPIYGRSWTNWGGKTKEDIIKQDIEEIITDKGEKVFIQKPDKIKLTKINGINQVNNIINLLKKDPDSRRIIIETWNVSEIDNMLLTPCHKTVQFYSTLMNNKERYYEFSKWAKNKNININGLNLNDASTKFNFPTRKLSLQIYIRSQDFYLGWSYNIAEYAIFLHMISQICNMLPYELVWTGGDVHLYNNSIDATKELMNRHSMSSPILLLNSNIKNIYDFRYDDIKIMEYDAHQNIKVDVAV